MSSSQSTDSEGKPLKSYRGNCHCGAFIFTLRVPEITTVEYCNCSNCRKKGYLWLIPDTTKGHKFEVVKDEGKLTEYVAGPKGTKYKFCKVCGTGVCAIYKKEQEESGKEGQGVLVNVRALQELKIWDLEVKEFDGKSIPPPYQPAPFDGPELTAEVENGVVYHGACHCGAVKVAVKTKGPLDKTYKERVVDCNCSVCQRGGYVWIYPSSSEQLSFAPQSRANLTSYACISKLMCKTFCKTCGVHLTNEFNSAATEDEIGAAIKGENGDMVMRWIKGVFPINIRCLDRCPGDDDWDFDKCVKELKVEKGDGWGKIQPGYVNP